VVYASKVNGNKLTLCVSGKLWNRSLVMMDVETKSLWSHILGEAMERELKGTRLKPLPSQMLTWQAWKKLHPETTVLDLGPTQFTEYTPNFYKGRPERFVYGAIVQGEAYHVPWPALTAKPIHQIDTPELPAVVIAENESTVVRIFDRRHEGKTLNFKMIGAVIVDEGTGSQWGPDGVATRGMLAGAKLEPMAGLMSFQQAWLNFHPTSKQIGSLGKASEKNPGEKNTGEKGIAQRK